MFWEPAPGGQLRNCRSFLAELQPEVGMVAACVQCAIIHNGIDTLQGGEDLSAQLVSFDPASSMSSLEADWMPSVLYSVG